MKNKLVKIFTLFCLLFMPVMFLFSGCKEDAGIEPSPSIKPQYMSFTVSPLPNNVNSIFLYGSNGVFDSEHKPIIKYNEKFRIELSLNAGYTLNTLKLFVNNEEKLLEHNSNDKYLVKDLSYNEDINITFDGSPSSYNVNCSFNFAETTIHSTPQEYINSNEENDKIFVKVENSLFGENEFTLTEFQNFVSSQKNSFVVETNKPLSIYIYTLDKSFAISSFSQIKNADSNLKMYNSLKQKHFTDKANNRFGIKLDFTLWQNAQINFDFIINKAIPITFSSSNKDYFWRELSSEFGEIRVNNQLRDYVLFTDFENGNKPKVQFRCPAQCLNNLVYKQSYENLTFMLNDKSLNAVFDGEFRYDFEIDNLDNYILDDITYPYYFYLQNNLAESLANNDLLVRHPNYYNIYADGEKLEVIKDIINCMKVPISEISLINNKDGGSAFIKGTEVTFTIYLINNNQYKYIDFSGVKCALDGENEMFKITKKGASLNLNGVEYNNATCYEIKTSYYEYFSKIEFLTE